MRIRALLFAFPALVHALACAPAAPAVTPIPPNTSPPASSAVAPAPAPPDCPALSPSLPSPPQAYDSGDEVSAANLRAWVDYLADPRMRGRRAGSPEAAHAGASLAARLQELGAAPVFPDGKPCQRFPLGPSSDTNLAARITAGDEKSARLAILIAHYDHIGVDASGRVYPGADDNASGVSAVLESARLLTLRAAKLPRDVLVVFSGAEEAGIVGSSWFVAHSPVALDSVDLVVNVDQVGRQLLEGSAAHRYLRTLRTSIGFVVSERGRQGLLASIERARQDTGTNLVGIPEDVLLASGFRSDSVPFSPFAPTLFLSSSLHDDYHQPSDTPDKIDLAQMARAVRIILSLLSTA